MSNKSSLSVVDIGNYCLLVKKYKEQLQRENLKISPNNDWFISECSRIISDHLQTMDECQKALYTQGTETLNAEEIAYLKELRDFFEEGVQLLQEVLVGFDLVIKGECKHNENENKKEEDN